MTAGSLRDAASRRTTPGKDVRTILEMTALVVVPAWLTLRTVDVPIDRIDWIASPDPTPHGYTWSLLLFVLPAAVLWLHVARAPSHPHVPRALRLSGLLLPLIGVVLDFAFGFHFFEFQNQGATLGIRLPAWSWSAMAFVPSYLPIEEFAFYVSGSLFVVTAYVWADDRWLPDYDPGDYESSAGRCPRLLSLNAKGTGLWVTAMVAGVVYADGFPGYFVFIMCIGALPTLLVLDAVRDFINWRAFAVAYLALLVISLCWEVTLGVPYEWWNYKGDQMLGIRIGAWWDLPIEAVILWTVAAWVSVVGYEVLRVGLVVTEKHERGWIHALFGHADELDTDADVDTRLDDRPESAPDHGRV